VAPILISDPISPLWKCIDNRIVRTLNRKVDSYFPATALLTYAVGSITYSQVWISILTEKIISEAIHVLNNYSHVKNIQSTIHPDKIRDLKGKLEEETVIQ
jgi:hypothetical protein